MTTNENTSLNGGTEVKSPTPATPATAAPATPAAVAPADPKSAVAAQRHDPEAIAKALDHSLSMEDSATADRFDKVAKAARAHREQLRESGETARTRPEDLGGARMKLSVAGTIPGYHLYWENDQHGAIETLLYAGFEFVTPEEVRASSAFVSDAELGFRISRFVGTNEEGKPMRAYLLKCTDEIWAAREKARYAQADEWDSSIRNGSLKGDGRYQPKGTSVDIDTSFRKEYT